MSAPGEQPRVPAGTRGLLEKLVAGIRPEFRAGVLTFNPGDPVFGGPPCAVPGCERPARNRNMCWGHRQRWLQAGKPDLAGFTASTSPEWSGHLPLPACEVDGCNYCQAGRGLCSVHHLHRAHYPVIDLAGGDSIEEGARGFELSPANGGHA